MPRDGQVFIVAQISDIAATQYQATP